VKRGGLSEKLGERYRYGGIEGVNYRYGNIGKEREGEREGKEEREGRKEKMGGKER
jgi:hypothetical protein